MTSSWYGVKRWRPAAVCQSSVYFFKESLDCCVHKCYIIGSEYKIAESYHLLLCECIAWISLLVTFDHSFTHSMVLPASRTGFLPASATLVVFLSMFYRISLQLHGLIKRTFCELRRCIFINNNLKNFGCRLRSTTMTTMSAPIAEGEVDSQRMVSSESDQDISNNNEERLLFIFNWFACIFVISISIYWPCVLFWFWFCILCSY